MNSLPVASIYEWCFFPPTFLDVLTGVVVRRVCLNGSRDNKYLNLSIKDSAHGFWSVGNYFYFFTFSRYISVS